MPAGISIVVCCYNSAKRLPETLQHIARQKVPLGFNWEIIVVNNNSTDDTGAVASSLCKELFSHIPYRIIDENKRGLLFARKKGVENAKYDVIGFIDDDNWMEENWVKTAYDIMAANEKAGATGGYVEGVYETKPPAWMHQFEHCIAVGKQGNGFEDITETRSHLWGAGLTIRKSILEKIDALGYIYNLTGRKENKVLSGEDFEICLLTILMGYRLIYSDKLRLKHFIPEGRTKWAYLKKLNYYFGTSSLYLDALLHFTKNDKMPAFLFLRWTKNLLFSLKSIMIKTMKILFPTPARRKLVISIQYNKGRFWELLFNPQAYRRNFEKIYTLKQQLRN